MHMSVALLKKEDFDNLSQIVDWKREMHMSVALCGIAAADTVDQL